MAQAKKVRIGFVGVGSMGQAAHLRNYAVLPECEVVALAELREDLGKAVAQKYGVPKVYRTHEEMLAAERLDGLVASQPFTRHATLLQDLLKAGLPIFIEKPLASSVAAAEAIMRAVAASGTWIMVGYHKRSDPASQWARAELSRLLSTNELGKLRYVRITMPPGDWVAAGFNELLTSKAKPGALEQDAAPTDLDAAGFDAYLTFVNYYIHQVNLMRFFLGEPYELRHADPAGVLLVGESKSGIPCLIEMQPYCTTQDWQESALMCLEHGWLRVDLPAPLAVNRPGQAALFKDAGSGVMPQTIVPQMPWEHAMRRQAANFLKAIRGEAPPPCDAAEAYEDLKVARSYLRLWKGL